MIELWRGCVNAWECDELGPFNVRFYLARASEALANLAEAAGLNPLQRPDALATLIPQTLHIRFLAEAHPGAPLYIEGGFVGHDSASADIVLVMRHSGTGKPAPSFAITLAPAAPARAPDRGSHPRPTPAPGRPAVADLRRQAPGSPPPWAGVPN